MMGRRCKFRIKSASLLQRFHRLQSVSRCNRQSSSGTSFILHFKYNLIPVSKEKCHRPIYGTPVAKGLKNLSRAVLGKLDDEDGELLS